MKLILLAIITFLVVPLSFAQEIKQYDKYTCIVEKVLEDCTNKGIYYATVDNQGFLLATEEQKTSENMRTFIISKEREFIEKNSKSIMLAETYPIIFCKNENENVSATSKNILGFNVDHLVWQGTTIDCAWIRQDIEQLITFTGKCPTFIYGDKNSLAVDCRDTTWNITPGEIVLFSFGGISILGGVTFGAFYLYARKKKSSQKKSK